MDSITILAALLFSLVIRGPVSLNLDSVKLLGIVSLAFGAFNLIPVPPMDGYRLVTLGRQGPIGCRLYGQQWGGD